MATTTRALYTKLAAELCELSYLTGIQGLLEWDQSVMMPAGASAAREQQMATLAGIVHEKRTAASIGDALKELQACKDLQQVLNPFELANIRDTERAYQRETKIPKELAKRIAGLASSSYTAWVEARQKSDFNILAPRLEEWVEVLQEKAKRIDPTLPPYQVLLEEFERGMPVERVDQLFETLKGGLLPLIRRIQASPHQVDNSYLEGRTFDVAKQTTLNHRIAKDLGFDTERGRLDVSPHPFTANTHYTDVRMTTRYRENDLVEGITGTVHETGHSLYEQGRNKDYADLPVSEPMSTGIHESQSLLWERMVALNENFWSFYWPVVQEQFPELSATTMQQFYRTINESKPGFIRVEADEVTYPMHIILRYELERDLFSGKITVRDLPRLWNAKMKEYLGIEPKQDSDGVLQDPHWAMGAFAYFPTYTIGAIYANQFFQKACKDIPGLEQQFASGQFQPLKTWLNQHVHEQGSLLGSGDALMRQVTGAPLDAQLFVEYLKNKYTKLYKL